MKTRKYRLAACLLCAVLAFTTLFGASAATENIATRRDSLTWKVENDTLVISGTGMMKNYTMAFSEKDSEGRSFLKGSTAPWNDEHFTKVVIEEGVTGIGDCAFYHNLSLTSVSLPETLVSIGDCAFTWCENLQEINLPDSLEVIGGSTFTDCTALKSIVLPARLKEIPGSLFCNCSSLTDVIVPDSVTAIRDDAFSGCSSLERIVLPASVAEIGANVFDACSYLENIIVEKDSFAERYCLDNKLPLVYTDELSRPAVSEAADEGISWRVENDTLIISGTGKMENYREITGPNGYLISTAPWYDSLFTRVIVEEGVTALGDCAFWNKTGITSITLPESLTSIGAKQFCLDGNLAEINLPDSVTFIGANAFSGCDALKSIRLPASLKKIEYGTFYGCNGLLEITVPDSVTSIESSAFNRCINLEKVVLPASVTDINNNVFDECGNLQDITVLKGSYAEQFCKDNNLPYTGVDKLPEQSEATDTGKAGLSWKVQNGTLTISGTGLMEDFEYTLTEPDADGRQRITGTTAPWDHEQFTRVVVEEGVTSLGKMAFYNHTGITDVILPESLVYIEANAFQSTGLSHITIPGSVRQIGASAFWHCIHLKEVTLPDSVTIIDTRAFMNCIRLEHINIPASIRKIGFEAFADCGGLKSITVAKGSSAEQYCIENRLPYDYGDGSPVHVPVVNTSISWKVENGTLTISGIGAMDDYQEVFGTHGTTGRGEFAGSSAPWDEENFSHVVIENGITSVGEHAFDNKMSVESVTLPESLTVIRKEAFGGCTNLTEIIIPESVTSIETNAFSLCLRLKSVILPDSLQEIGFGAFQGCESLKEIRIPGSVSHLGAYAFTKCVSLESAVIPASVTEIEDNIFKGCENLKTVVVEKDSAAEQYCIDNNLPYSYE